MSIDEMAPAQQLAREEQLRKLTRYKNAFIALAILGGLVGIGAVIALAVQGNSSITVAPLILVACPYVFAAYVAGYLSLPGYNAALKKALKVPLLGWMGVLIMGWLGIAIWMFAGLFTLPHQVKKLRRQLRELQ
jgi:hypothetical protein